MWTDVIIGEHSNKNCSAVKLNNYSFSHNRVSYWFSHLICDLGMTVYKDTEEGQHITRMIKENTLEEYILKYANSILLKNIEPEKLISYINSYVSSEKRKAAETAETTLQQRLRNLLGFEDF